MSGRQISLREFASFASRYSAVLETLFKRSDDEFSRADLLSIAASVSTDEAASPESIVRTMEEYRLIEKTEEQATTYRYPRALIDLHRHFSMLSEPVSAQSITANVSALSQAGADIRLAVAGSNSGAARNAADEIRRLCNDVLRGVSENYKFILHEALELKKGDGSMTIKQRYERLDHAWARYIEPLRMIVLVQGSFSHHVAEADSGLAAAEKTGVLPDAEEVRMLRRFLGLVVQTANRSMADCLKTVQPLLNRLKQDGRVAHGAAVGISQFIHVGPSRSGIPALLRIISVREQDRFQNNELSSVLRTLLSLKPSPPPIIPESSSDLRNGQQVDMRFAAEAIASVEAAGTVTDLLTFLHDRFPDRHAFDHVSIFHYLTKEESGFTAHFGPMKDYELLGASIQSAQLSLTLK